MKRYAIISLVIIAVGGVLLYFRNIGQADPELLGWMVLLLPLYLGQILATCCAVPLLLTFALALRNTVAKGIMFVGALIWQIAIFAWPTQTPTGHPQKIPDFADTSIYLVLVIAAWLIASITLAKISIDSDPYLQREHDRDHD